MIDPQGIAIIKEFEGLKLTAYLCPAGIPTIGYGHTDGLTKADVGVKTITRAEADKLLMKDVNKVQKSIDQSFTLAPGPLQLAAMVSLAFNIGAKAFKTSSVVKAHNRGDYVSAGRAFNMWTKATVNGKKVDLPGLVSRRARESALYLTATHEEMKTDMPQAVESPAPLVMTNTNKGAITAGTLVTLSTAAEVTSTVSNMAYSATPIMDLIVKIGPTIFFALLALGAIGYIVWSRYKARKDGKI